MAGIIKAVKGMHDVPPERSHRWLFLERVFADIVQRYGYRQIRMPLVERAELFKRTVGEATDIVEKEMYGFVDRNDDQLSLRPEGTASCVRACIENGLLRQGPLRLWYGGPMFRRERPQKGRYRQFHQFGVEAFAMPGPDIDVELILMTDRLWKALDIDGLELQINSLGTAEARKIYREKLVAYFERNQDDLDEDSRRRLTTNPLRILDSKNPGMQALIESAPVLTDYLDEDSESDFSALQEMLDDSGISYRINTRLVRGLDYYEKLVFEWVGHIGAQSTVCAGGRYDGLVSQLGGASVPAAGFALGIERVLALMEESDIDPENPHVCLIVPDHTLTGRGLNLAESLRDDLPFLRLLMICGGGNLKKQFRKADRSMAELAIIYGRDEYESGEISVKFLRQKRDQIRIKEGELRPFLSREFEIQ